MLSIKCDNIGQFVGILNENHNLSSNEIDKKIAMDTLEIIDTILNEKKASKNLFRAYRHYKKIERFKNRKNFYCYLMRVKKCLKTDKYGMI